MLSWFLLVHALVLPAAHGAEFVASGQDGLVCPVEPTSVSIRSNSNDNSRYQVRLVFPDDFPCTQVRDSEGAMATTSPNVRQLGGAHEALLWAPAKAARALAARLGVPVEDRRDLQQLLQPGFRIDGTQIWLSLQNESDSMWVLDLPGYAVGVGNGGFAFEVHEGDRLVVGREFSDWSGIGSWATIPPRGQQVDLVRAHLDKWFTPRPDKTYRIRAFWRTEMCPSRIDARVEPHRCWSAEFSELLTWTVPSELE